MNVYDATRCPECDFELWKVLARQVRIVAVGFELPSVDLIVCTRCMWWRQATDRDLSVLEALPRLRRDEGSVRSPSRP